MTNPQIRVLHVWDYRVNSGTNIDDHLTKTDLNQLSVSRVLTRNGNADVLPQRSLYTLKKMVSPFPTNILARKYSKLKFVIFLKSQIRDFKPDVIFFHFGQTAASLIEPLAKFKIPFVVAFYGHDISVALHQRRWVEKYKIFPQTDASFLVLSRDVQRRVEELGVDPARITIYNYPLQLGPYLSVEKAKRGPRFNIAIPGRLVEKKGHFILFQALHILKNQGLRPNLKVIGYGSDWQVFKSKAAEAGISDQVEWIDTASATIGGDFDALYGAILAQTDLVALPCLTSSKGDDEAGPALVLCLAQASGTPVLTTPFEGHEVSISDHKTGILAVEGDAKDLANKIGWCIHHPQELAKIAEEGKIFVQKVFDQDSNLKVIREVIDSQAKKSPSQFI